MRAREGEGPSEPERKAKRKIEANPNARHLGPVHRDAEQNIPNEKPKPNPGHYLHYYSGPLLLEIDSISLKTKAF